VYPRPSDTLTTHTHPCVFKPIPQASDATTTVAAEQANGTNRSTAAAAANFEYYLSAADKGDRHAQNELGLIYNFGGRGVNQNYTMASKWFRAAAKQALPIAQFNLGSLFLHGHGVEQNFTTGLAYY
jgi:TPR repeat protein